MSDLISDLEAAAARYDTHSGEVSHIVYDEECAGAKVVGIFKTFDEARRHAGLLNLAGALEIMADRQERWTRGQILRLAARICDRQPADDPREAPCCAAPARRSCRRR